MAKILCPESANNGQTLETRWVQRVARDVGFEPTRPFDHRLSRPAPYQARAIPQTNLNMFLLNWTALTKQGMLATHAGWLHLSFPYHISLAQISRVLQCCRQFFNAEIKISRNCEFPIFPHLKAIAILSAESCLWFGREPFGSKRNRLALKDSIWVTSLF